MIFKKKYEDYEKSESNKSKENKENNKNKLFIKILIIIAIIVVAINVFIKKDDDTEPIEIKEQEETELIKTDVERDIFYFYGIAYEIYMEVQEEYTESEIKSNLKDMGYLDDDVKNMFIELQINWETKEIQNKESQFYTQMLEDGIIFEDGIEIAPLPSNDTPKINTGYTIKQKTDKSEQQNQELPNISIEKHK